MSELIYFGNTDEAINWLKTLTPNVKHLLTAKKWTKKRTLDQNAQSHVWYAQIAESLKEESAQGWARYCKLHHGVPILRANDAEYREFYDKAIKNNLRYEDKLKAMDFVPVTRLMNTEQFNWYFECLQDEFFKRGVKLEFLEAR